MFHAESAQAINMEQVALVLGWSNVFFGLTLALSCRSCVTAFKTIFRHDLRKLLPGFFQYHAYYWWAFGIVILAHVMMAVFHTGLPVPGDPDVGIHWAILAFGIATTATVTGIFISCRVSPWLFNAMFTRSAFANRGYRAYFRRHGWMWAGFGALLAVHIATAIMHVGV